MIKYTFQSNFYAFKNITSLESTETVAVTQRIFVLTIHSSGRDELWHYDFSSCETSVVDEKRWF